MTTVVLLELTPRGFVHAHRLHRPLSRLRGRVGEGAC